MPNSPTLVAGADGCPKGWIAIVLKNGSFVRAELASTFAELLSVLTDTQIIGVDIPIGLPDGPDPRPADLEAKRLLGPRRSSVFLTPPRPVLECRTYTGANRLSKQLFNRGISAQSYALRRKIFEVDTCAVGDDRIFEVHPEVCFAGMNGEPLTHSKKSWHGQRARLRLLANAGITIPDDLGGVGKNPPDDIIDAAAAAWSAERIVSGKADCLGEPTHDGTPNPSAGRIWY
jgi:predicted RNase H-like nuclease